MTLRIKNHAQIQEDVVRARRSLEERIVMTQQTKNGIREWYVTFAPEPQSLKQRVSKWIVGKFTPEWSLIREATTIEPPFSREEAEDAFRVDLDVPREYRVETDKVMVLSFI